VDITLFATEMLTPGEELIANNLEQFLLVLAVSLAVATLPQVFSWFRQIPYTLLLVIVGLGLAFVDVRLVDLSPGLILAIFLPPLLFEAAWSLRWADLKKDLLPVCLFALLGVVISIAGVALGLNQFAGVPIITALLIGASLSPTDPVSVVALFRQFRVDKRLRTLVEGESLFNDGMAVVAFSVFVGIPLGRTELTPPQIVGELLAVIGIGLGIGILVGFGVSYLTQRLDLPLVEQSLTLVAAYSTYLVTEDMGGSGVIAVVTTSLILGNFGSRIGMNPRTRLIVTEFWDFLAFFVNSIVFLLIGDQVQFLILGDNLPIIAVTIVAMIASRAIAIYSLGFVSNTVAGSEISIPEQTALCWVGLRGAVSIALALSVPKVIGDREEIIATVFGVVLFTLLFQGLTTKPLLQILGLMGSQAYEQDYEQAVAKRAALGRVLAYLERGDRKPEVDPDSYRDQTALVKDELAKIEDRLEKLQMAHPELKEFTAAKLQDELTSIEAETYAEFVRAGRLSKEPVPYLSEILTGNKFPPVL
jgi:monovalent cation:H+ antiporter, CPA1 family